MKTKIKHFVLVVLLMGSGISHSFQTATAAVMVGQIPGSFQTTSSGGVTYIIPIECPGGINNMQPSLALAYSSQSGNGIAGWGWDLSGLSSIMRTQKTKYYDSVEQEISWTSADSLTLDGIRLMPVRKWNNDSIEYRLEHDPGLLIRGYSIQSWGPIYLKTFDKSGWTRTYGKSGDNTSYELMYTNATASTGAVKAGWKLIEIVDPNGNFMKLEYMNSSGSYKGNTIKKITYGGNKQRGTTGVLVVSFEYTNRPDPIQGYRAGKESLQQLRLSKIKTSASGVTQKEYRLTHEVNRVSRLKAIELYDRGTKQYNPLTFTYGETDKSPEITDISFIRKNAQGNEKDKRGLTAIDLDGDGYLELGDIYYTENLFGESFGMVHLNLEIHKKSENWGQNATTQWSFPVGFAMGDRTGTVLQSTVQELFADFNGNGSSESVFTYFEGNDLGIRITDRSTNSVLCDEFMSSTNTPPFISTGTYLGNILANVLIVYNQPQSSNGGYQYQYEMILSGINGQVFPSPFDAYLWVPSKIKYAVTIRSGSASYRDDLFLILEDGTTRILKNTQDQREPFTNSTLINTGLNLNSKDLMQFADMNNDGLLDIVFRKSLNTWKIGFNRGDGTFTVKSLSINCSKQGLINVENDNLLLVDVNNDDLPDIVVGDETGSSSTTWRFYLNNGAGGYTLWKTVTSPERAAYSCMADLYGKGALCWAYAPSSSTTVITDFGFGLNKNLLTKVENPVSPALELKYKPQIECKFKEGTTNPYLSDLSIGYIPFRSTQIPIISESYDGLNHIHYDYGRALINWLHRGFVGFLNQKEYNETTNMRTEKINHIYQTNRLYNMILPSTTQQYEGATSTYRTAYESNGYTLKPLNGKRFALQQTSHNISDEVSYNSSRETYSYDEYNNVTTQQKVNSWQTLTTTTQYAKAGAWCLNVPVTETTTELVYDSGNEVSKIHKYTYDGRGNVTSCQTDYGNPMNIQIAYSNIDQFGHPTRITRTANSVSRSSSATYSTSGRFITSETNEKGETTTRQWDEARGLLLTETTRYGTTTYTYDSFGNLIITTHPDGTWESNSLLWASSAPNSPVSGCKYATMSETQGSSPLVVWYNTLGQEIASRALSAFDNKSIYMFTQYQTDGKVTRVSKPTYNTSPNSSDWARTYEYDFLGRVIKITTPAGEITTEYATGGSHDNQMCRMEITTTPDSYTEKFYRDGLLRQSLTNGKTVYFTYTLGGKIQTATPEDGIAVTIQYDRNGNRTQIIDPSTSTINSTYDAWGQLIKTTQPVHSASNLITTTYSYNTNGLLTQKKIGSAITNYTYDNYKRLTGSSISQASKTYTYDNYDRILSVSSTINGKTLTSSKEYDTYGRVVKETYPSGYYITNIYDAYGQLIAITDESSRQIWQLLTRDAEGNVLTEKKGNAVSTYQYNSKNQLTSISAPGIVNMQYTYYPTGNVKSYTDGITNQTINYKYDALDRLVSWKTPNESYPFNELQFDSKNRIQYKNKEDGYHAFYDKTNQPYQLSSISYAAKKFPFDIGYTDFKKVGNILMEPNVYYFSYGPDEECLYMEERYVDIDNNYRTTICREQYYAENYEEDMWTGLGGCHYIYGGNGLAAIYTAGGYPARFYNAYTDRLGSLIAMIRNNIVEERYAYNPWGLRLNPQNWDEKDTRTDLLMHRGYTMHEHYDNIGLINMKARLYDPYLCQFIAPDPQLQSPENWLNYNRYSYCLNNPLKYTDPTGEFFWTILSAVKDLIRNTIINVWSEGINAWTDSKNWHSTRMAWKIDSGLFKGNLKQIFSRFTWESPQTLLGYTLAGGYNFLGKVESVTHWGGATAIESKTEDRIFGGSTKGITFGSYILGAKGLQADPANPLFQHEYGHYLQSQSHGPAYLYTDGIPSAFGSKSVEIDANKRAFKYFSENVAGFNYQKSDGTYGSMWDFYNAGNQIPGYKPTQPYDSEANQKAIRRNTSLPDSYHFNIK